jgi:hypothetical protein
MKLRYSSTHVALLACATLIVTGDALAAGPRVRRVEGVVRSVDRDSQTVILDHDVGAAPKKIMWNGETRFVRDTKLATPADLTGGTRTDIRYRWPFFGKPFATHIAWRSEAGK